MTVIVAPLAPRGGGVLTIRRWVGLAASVVLSVACAPSSDRALDVNGGMTSNLPANSKIFLFGNTEAIEFIRTDRGDDEPLDHETIGSGSSLEAFAYIIDPGQVSPGETIAIASRCPTCEMVREITFGRDVDLTAPSLVSAPTAVASGLRLQPYDLLIHSYEVTVSAPGPVDTSTVLMRTVSDEFEALRVNNGFAPGVPLQVSFLVEGGMQRRLCFAMTLLDLAGNETQLPEELCVDLAASTARPWGEQPLPTF